MNFKEKEHNPIPHSIRETTRWFLRNWNWAKLLGGTVTAGGAVSGGILAWNQLHPTVPQEQSKDAPRDIFPQPAQPEIKAVIPWPNETTTPMATPEPSPTTTPTTAPATATATRTATAVPSGYIMENGSLIYRTEKGDILKLPKVPGLEIKLEGNKATYVDKEGRYAGEFVPNVSMANETGKQEQRGGLVLTAPVVEKLLQDKLASIPTQEDKWMIILPVDIRDSDQATSAYFGSQTFGRDSVSFVYISLPGKSPLTNVIPKAKELRIVTSFVPNYMQYYDPLLNMEDNSSNKVKGSEMSYTYVLSKLERGTRKIQSKFGDKVGDVDGAVMMAYGVPGNFSAIGRNKILTVGNTPVSLAANPSS